MVLQTVDLKEVTMADKLVVGTAATLVAMKVDMLAMSTVG